MTVPWQQVNGWLLNLLSLAVFGCVVYVLIRLQKKVLAAIQQRLDVGNHLEQNNRVLELLSELRAATAADRAFVFQFHNGGRFFNGADRLRMSCTCESVGNGISREQTNEQDILVCTVQDAVKFLTVRDPRKEAKLQYTKDIPDGYYRAVLDTQGVKVTAKYPLYKADAIVGFFGVDIVRDKTLSLNLDLIKSYAPRIEMAVNRAGLKTSVFRLLLWNIWR